MTETFSLLMISGAIIGVLVSRIVQKNSYLAKKGEHPKYGEYEIVSLDGGRHWFNYTKQDKDIIIYGPADIELIEALAWAGKIPQPN